MAVLPLNKLGYNLLERSLCIQATIIKIEVAQWLVGMLVGFLSTSLNHFWFCFTTQ